jgi:CheY-like chemotaxis protein
MRVNMPKILVIEDEESVRENLIDLLEAENFEVVAAANGKIGLRHGCIRISRFNSL